MKRYILIGLLILSSLTKSNQFINGVDISMLKQVEENGGLFYENGNQIDPIQIFKDKGIDKATMEEIAHAAGFGTATLYYYFPSKEEVFAAILIKGWKTLWEEIEDTIHSDKEAEIKFLDTLYQIAGTAIKNPNL